MINWLSMIVIALALAASTRHKSLPLIILLYYITYLAYDASFGFWELKIGQVYSLGDDLSMAYDIGYYTITAAVVFLIVATIPWSNKTISIAYSCWLAATIYINAEISLALWNNGISETTLMVWQVACVVVDIVAAWLGSSNSVSRVILPAISRGSDNRLPPGYKMGR